MTRVAFGTCYPGHVSTVSRLLRMRAFLHPAARTADEHTYLSTACLHGEHGYCQHHTGLSGAKTPGVCKFCAAPCVCPCHETPADDAADASGVTRVPPPRAASSRA